LETNQTENPSEEKEPAAKVKKAVTEKTTEKPEKPASEKTEKAEKPAPSRPARTKPAEKKATAKPREAEAKGKSAPKKEEKISAPPAQIPDPTETPEDETEHGGTESPESAEPVHETKKHAHFSSRMLNRGTPEELEKKKRKKIEWYEEKLHAEESIAGAAEALEEFRKKYPEHDAEIEKIVRLLKNGNQGE